MFIAIPRTLGRRPRFRFRPAFPRFRSPKCLLGTGKKRGGTDSARPGSKMRKIQDDESTHFDVCPTVHGAILGTRLISPLCNLMCVIFSPSKPTL